MNSLRILGPCLGALLCTGATAQHPSKVIQVGDPIPGSPGDFVGGLHGVSANSQGGYVVHLNASAFGGKHMAWGKVVDGSGGVLHKAGNYDGWTQNLWPRVGVGLDDFGRTSNAALVLPLFKHSIWFMNQLIAKDPENSTVAGYSWKSFPFVGMAPGAAKPYFIGHLEENVMTGTPEIRGLFLGLSKTPLLVTGDSIGGIPGEVEVDPFGPGAVDLSSDATRWVAAPHLDNGTQAVVVDGDVHETLGNLFLTGEAIPPLWGVDSWSGFRDVQINDAGDVAFIGECPGSQRIVRNDEVVLRTGEIVDGGKIVALRHLAMNSRGTLAYRALLADGTWAIGIEDTLVTRQGESVDSDGDGFLELGSTAQGFGVDTTPWQLSFGDDHVLRFLLEVDTAGTPLDPSDDDQGVYRYDYDPRGPITYCTAKPTSLGCLPTIGFTGTPSLGGVKSLQFRLSSVPKNTVGTLGYSTLGKAALPFHGGTLCIQPPLRRTPGTQKASVIVVGPCTTPLLVDFGAHLASGADPALSVGTEVFVQWFFRDPGAPLGVGHTEAARFTIRP